MKAKYFLVFIVAALLLWGIPETAAAAGGSGVVPGSAGERTEDSAGQNGDLSVLSEENDMEEMADETVPAAELSSVSTSGKFSWRGFLLCFLALVILGVGIWAVFKSRNEKEDRKQEKRP